MIKHTYAGCLSCASLFAPLVVAKSVAAENVAGVTVTVTVTDENQNPISGVPLELIDTVPPFDFVDDADRFTDESGMAVFVVGDDVAEGSVTVAIDSYLLGAVSASDIEFVDSRQSARFDPARFSTNQRTHSSQIRGDGTCEIDVQIFRGDVGSIRVDNRATPSDAFVLLRRGNEDEVLKLAGSRPYWFGGMRAVGRPTVTLSTTSLLVRAIGTPDPAGSIDFGTVVIEEVDAPVPIRLLLENFDEASRELFVTGELLHTGIMLFDSRLKRFHLIRGHSKNYVDGDLRIAEWSFPERLISPGTYQVVPGYRLTHSVQRRMVDFLFDNHANVDWPTITIPPSVGVEDEIVVDISRVVRQGLSVLEGGAGPWVERQRIERRTRLSIWPNLQEAQLATPWFVQPAKSRISPPRARKAGSPTTPQDPAPQPTSTDPATPPTGDASGPPPGSV